MSIPTRERRWWTKEEDEVLQNGAQIQIDEHGIVKNWNNVADLLPDRTNKDCRKRWNKVRLDLRKGAWTPDEDEKLQKAIAEAGLKWSAVSKIMKNRNGDQCAKRWQHVIGPDFKHAPWTAEEDRTLKDAIVRYGNNWKQIGLSELPDRSTHDIRNRSVALGRRIRNPTLPSPKPIQPLSPDSTDHVSEDEEEGDESDDEDSEMIYESQPCISNPRIEFNSTRGTQTPAISEPPRFSDVPMEQNRFPSWEMLEMQSPLSTNSNPWFQMDSPAESSLNNMFHEDAFLMQTPLNANSNSWSQLGIHGDAGASMLGENAFDFSFLDEGRFGNMTENPSEGPSKTQQHNESPSGPPSSPNCDKTHVSGEQKGSVTLVLKGNSGLTQELLGNLMKLNGDLTIHVVKD